MAQGRPRKSGSDEDFLTEVLGGLSCFTLVTGLLGFGWVPFLLLIALPLAVLVYRAARFLLDAPASAA